MEPSGVAQGGANRDMRPSVSRMASLAPSVQRTGAAARLGAGLMAVHPARATGRGWPALVLALASSLPSPEKPRCEVRWAMGGFDPGAVLLGPTARPALSLAVIRPLFASCTVISSN